MGTLLQDVRYGLRMLAMNPGFTAVAVLTLALGIGANTAIFSVVNGVLIRPLPYRNPGQLVLVWEQLKNLGLNRFAAPIANYLDYRVQNRVFEDIAAFEYAHFDLTLGDQPDRLSGMRATANLFPLLGVEAALGRTFVSEENQPGNDGVVILSDAFWRRQFGADRGVLGKPVLLSGRLFTVVGVLPRSFRFSVGSSELPDVWVPVALQPDPNRNQGGLQLIARLKTGVSAEQAAIGMKAVAARLEEDAHLYRGPHGEDPGYDLAVVPLRQDLAGNARESLLVMLGAVGFVLLIACANVASLLLARTSSRQREMAVRAALGGGRSRLIRQILTESVLLSLIAGGLGLILAFGGIRILVVGSPYHVFGLLDTDPDGSILVFTLGVSILTALIFGLAPAVQGTKTNLSEALKESARGSGATLAHRRFQQGLVIVEVAISLVLVIGAGLLIRSFLSLQKVRLGFSPEKVMTARLTLPQSDYRENYQVAAFYQQLLDRVASLPSVRSAGMVSSLPLGGGAGRDPFSIEGQPWRPFGAGKVPQVVDHQAASPGYFRAMQIPLLKGRDFASDDTQATAPVAIVNETLVRGFGRTRDAIGMHLMIGAPGPGVPWLTVVGVVADVRTSTPEATPIPQIYIPHSQSPARSMTLVVRTAAEPETVISAVRREALALDRKLPVYGLASMEQVVSDSVAPRRYNMLLLGTLAALALILAAVGLYGVLSYWVVQRTREIGIRMALGADRKKVLRLVVAQGFFLTLAGVVVGVSGALALTRFLESLLFGVEPTDPVTFVLVPILLTAVALLACYIPARRATKIDPMVALRYE